MVVVVVVFRPKMHCGRQEFFCVRKMHCGSGKFFCVFVQWKLHPLPLYIDQCTATVTLTVYFGRVKDRGRVRLKESDGQRKGIKDGERDSE